MTWTTFGGELQDVWWALVVQHTHEAGLAPILTGDALVRHVHRGIARLSAKGKISAINDLLDLAKRTQER